MRLVAFAAFLVLAAGIAAPAGTQLAERGAYRLFLQFKRDGVVHTASSTVEVAR